MNNDAGFLETIIKDSKIVSPTKVTTNKNEVKTAPSLFDTILNDVKQSQETTLPKDTSVVSGQSKELIGTQEISTKTSNNEVKNDTTNSNNTITPKTNTSSSLLDKLIQEITNQASSETSSENQVQINTKENLSSKDKNPSYEEEKKIPQKNVLNDTLENKKESTSLLDKLLQEVNQSIKNESQASNEISNKINNIITKEISSEPLIDKNLTQQVTETTTKEPVENKLNQNITSEHKTKNTSLSISSLLDKLVQDANIQIKKETSTKVEQLNIEETKIAQIKKETPTILTQLNIEETKIPQIKKETPTTVEQLNIEETKIAQIKKETPTTVTQLNIEETKIAQIKKEIPITATQLNATEIKEVQTKDTSSILEQKIVNTKEIITKEVVLNDVKSTLIKTEIVKEQVVSSTTTPNEKMATEWAKISTSGNEKVSVSKEELLNLKENKMPVSNDKDTGKSLLDRLLDETKTTKITQDNSENTKTVNVTNARTQTDLVLNNIYLSSLNKSSQGAFLEKTHEVKNIIINATSVKDVHKGANLLNLGLQSSEVIIEEDQFKQNVKNDFLNKLSVTRDVITHDITKINEEIVMQRKSIKNEVMATTINNLLTSKDLPEIEVTVSSTTAYNIENRIIGARQNMNTMMSDMARNMYLNYKPPVTAFRMNLNPGTLGAIAVLIRSERDNGLSISLNMSNVATLDSFVDNQAALRAALAKNFNTNANINLEFNMQDGQQQDSNAQHNKKQQQQQQQQDHRATNDILETLNNSKSSEKVTNYM